MQKRQVMVRKEEEVKMEEVKMEVDSESELESEGGVAMGLERMAMMLQEQKRMSTMVQGGKHGMVTFHEVAW